MYANKDLFAVDESVQREALKNFYEQRAGVKFQDSNPWLTNLKNITGGEEKTKECHVDLVLGSARLGDRLRCHLLDHGHRELSEPQRQDGQREGGG